MGRRAHLPDARGRRQVEALAAYGVPERDIGRVLGIDPKTLRKQLPRRTRPRRHQGYRQGRRVPVPEGHQCVTAAIFWMKTRGGWREAPQAHEIAVHRDVRELTDAELEARIRELDRHVRPLLDLKPVAQGQSGS